MTDKQEYATVDLNQYIDLTDANCDLTQYKIESVDIFNCHIINNTTLDIAEKVAVPYRGFILAKSKGENAYTICDIDFQRSTTDKKYGTRLTFRRTNKSLQDKPVNRGQFFQRIAFDSGENGYREFWKMIAFLEKFNQIIDVGEFSGQFKIASTEDVALLVKSKGKLEQVECMLDIIEKSNLDEKDLENAILYKNRQKDLEEFKSLLENTDDYRGKYRELHSVTKSGDEAIWSHFSRVISGFLGLI